MSSSESPNAVEDGFASKPHGSSLPLLIVSFIIAFGGACAALLAVGHYALHAPRSLSPFSTPALGNHDDSDWFGDRFVVSAAGVFQKALVGEKVNPVPGRDYTFFVWVKLRRVPAPGEVYSILGKFDAVVSNRPGYALSLEGAPDGVRPRVYLSAASEQGRWYSFAVHPMNRKRWYLVAVSISQDTFVSAHITEHGSDQQPVLLGGHRIRISSLPYSASDLVVGAFGASRFRGFVGPFGVLSGEQLQTKLAYYLTAMRVDPGTIPSAVASGTVQLWATPRRDLGPNKFEIIEGRREDRQESAPMPTLAKRSGAPKGDPKRLSAKKKATAPAKQVKSVGRPRS